MAIFTESAVVKLSINTAAAAPGTSSSTIIPEGNWEVFDCVAVLTSAASTNADLTVKVGGSDCFDGPVIGDGSALANLDPDKTMVRFLTMDDDHVSIDAGTEIEAIGVDITCDVFVHIRRV